MSVRSQPCSQHPPAVSTSLGVNAKCSPWPTGCVLPVPSPTSALLPPHQPAGCFPNQQALLSSQGLCTCCALYLGAFCGLPAIPQASSLPLVIGLCVSHSLSVSPLERELTRPTDCFTARIPRTWDTAWPVMGVRQSLWTARSLMAPSPSLPLQRNSWRSCRTSQM